MDNSDAQVGLVDCAADEPIAEGRFCIRKPALLYYRQLTQKDCRFERECVLWAAYTAPSHGKC